MDEESGSNVVDVGVDLSEFYNSVEWDILDVPAVRFVALLLVVVFNSLNLFKRPLTHFAEMRNSIHAAMNHTWTLPSTLRCDGKHYSTLSTSLYRVWEFRF